MTAGSGVCRFSCLLAGHPQQANTSAVAMTPGQLFSLRPLARWARHRTPVRNLWLCGSGAHPGGGVMGAPGALAAKRMLAVGAL